MKMKEIGYHHRHDRYFCVDRQNGFDDWLMLLVKTPAVFRVNGELVPMPANTFILFTPQHPIYYYTEHDNYYDDWFHFIPNDEEEELLRSLEIPFNTPVALPDITELSATVRNMCYEKYSANINRKTTIKYYFRILLYKLHEKMTMHTDTTKVTDNIYLSTLLWVRECIYRWPGRDWSIDDMAKELSLSRSRFQHLYSETFGVSVNKDLITSRLARAKELLATTDLSINDIAIDIGYNGISYFLRQFKAAFGVTPMQYRSMKIEMPPEDDSL
ncbi:MAG: helix-turn-helix transcriptional regulator [Oscillospiraceae bacterium]|nr:helix-turn-helix transcriptional regulator [Oscillospiraceae bacterium]